ncbi:MAG TPA: aquaporin [Candidatus Saccharimonadales bacterium]|nr:aquaporin [Candidatus Saccharimonadales bacterium]
MIAHEKTSVEKEFRALVAELFGAFALTFAGVGIASLAHAPGSRVDFIAQVITPALMVMAVIYSLGRVSGAHINPAVTFAFAIRRAFEWRRVPGYIIVQLIGAVLAVLLLKMFLSNTSPIEAPLPDISLPLALGMEAILTLLLVTVIIGTATGSKIVGPNAGIAVGGTVALCSALGATTSGGSMNPALSFGALLVTGKLEMFWIYLVGPIIGASLAVLLNYLTHGKPTKHELTTASGEAEKAE